MAFDDEMIEGLAEVRDRAPIFVGDCAGIKKTSTIIELKNSRSAWAFKRLFYLARDRSGRPWRIRCVPPQIAHHAFPRAFPIRQENGEDIFDPAVRSPFLFVDDGESAFGGNVVARPAALGNPADSFPGCRGGDCGAHDS